MVGDKRVDVSDRDRLQVTIDYFIALRSAGVSAAVAQRRLAGLSFHFKLRGWGDVTKHFLVRQALKGWKKEYVPSECRRPVSYPAAGSAVGRDGQSVHLSL